jgi:hypothetical protein
MRGGGLKGVKEFTMGGMTGEKEFNEFKKYGSAVTAL